VCVTLDIITVTSIARINDFRVWTYTFILSSQGAIALTKVLNKEQMEKLNIQLPLTDTKEFTARLYLYNNKNYTSMAAKRRYYELVYYRQKN
jgi:hypothetical protein